MPKREPLETNHYYHVYNRSPHNLKIFQNQQSAIEFERTLLYYLQAKPPVKFSLRDVLKDKKDDFSNPLATLSAYCIMPTHFHLLVKQEVEGGISRYLRLLQSSFSHYYNSLHDSHGSLFQGRFQAKPVSIRQSRLYVSRYIHRNPLVANIVTDLARYPYSSYKHYLKDSFPPAFDPSAILGQNITSKEYLSYINTQELQSQALEVSTTLLIDDPGT